MTKTEKRDGAHPLIYILTGLFLLMLCTALCAVALIRPFEKVQTYLNLAFMDNMKITPSAGLDGLVIKENAISTEQRPDAELSGTGTVIRPSFGEQYAVLECEAIGMLVPVYWGSSTELLELGACQATSSKVLGDTGNVVIDAHVNTFFADLNKIEPGAQIVLYTTYGVFTYEATAQVTFENTDKTYVLPTEEDHLTLYTCKAQVLGTSTTRIGVVCDLVSKQFYANATGEEVAE